MFLLREKLVLVASERVTTTYESSGSSGWALGPGRKDEEVLRRRCPPQCHVGKLIPVQALRRAGEPFG